MTLRNASTNFFLWFSVIGLSLWVGGTIFSMTVIVPMWSASPPQSVADFFGGTSFTEHIYNFFGPPWMAIRTLPILICLGLTWYSKYHRRYLLITILTLAFGVIFTLLYVYPINSVLMAAGAGKSPEEITKLVNNWIIADRFRFAVMIIGYFFLLKAFRLPIPKREAGKSESN